MARRHISKKHPLSEDELRAEEDECEIMSGVAEDMKVRSEVWGCVIIFILCLGWWCFC